MVVSAGGGDLNRPRNLNSYLGHHHQPAATARGLGVLAADLEVPVVTETTMVAAALHALEVVAESDVQRIGGHVGGLAILEILATVQEPHRDLGGD